jgi:hypothetical protein
MIRHEMEHIRHFEKTGKPGGESAVDAVAASSRPRALFRVLHSAVAARAAGAAPRWDNFFDRFRGERTSYLHAYLHLTPDQHLAMATTLVRRQYTREDRVLAQLHLGAVFGGSDPWSVVFKKALALLKKEEPRRPGPRNGRRVPSLEVRSRIDPASTP